MAFELFTPDEPRHHIETVTLMKVGRLAISSATYKHYWKDNKYALLYFDKEARKIGIQPVSEPVPNSYEVAEGPKKNHQIGATAFCHKYGISFEKSIKFPVEWDDKIQMVVIGPVN